MVAFEIYGGQTVFMKSVIDDPKSKTLKEIMNCYELFKLERFRKNAVRGNDLKLADFIGQRMRDLCSLNCLTSAPLGQI